MPDVEGFWAVVPAGGAGTRLWPLSRAGHPKFLLDLTGSGRTLLQATVDRLTPLTADRVVVVTGAAHADSVRGQLPGLPRDRVLAEPSPRDSMAAIGLAAAVVERIDPDAVVGSFAADHVIPDTGAFHTAVREAVEVARDGHLVTLGVEPTHPATGFGYIRAGEPLDGASTALRALEFVEKPDAERAAAYLETGGYRWNAGMFVARAGTLLDLLTRWHPALAAGLREIAAEPARLDDLWPQLERIAIDHAVAEPAAADGRVVVVPAPFTWDDIGDFASLGSLLPVEEGVAVLGDRDLVHAADTRGLVVPAGGRRVAVVGMDDVVVVDTPDALLVTTRARAQEVKGVVEALRAEGRTHLL
ncbi:mannose-1-phosphate guanylyltransferase [Phycicoccus sp. CSK15P-2]|uniref:mannose-1-phosphate guanylyltransferase n=1 Tax=Phycicoccus sp. CSK15P-2 TaxID=2807627 RepID=UPI001950B3DD|nr:mannose-1-phosphate guanylyltransferase [Phycicoccus sp. CSK15P-2]MBM6402881.1 mannose-1-phosphate guanylyltransferase [Phycicoccus sp. CSK15P-2]